MINMVNTDLVPLTCDLAIRSQLIALAVADQSQIVSLIGVDLVWVLILAVSMQHLLQIQMISCLQTDLVNKLLIRHLQQLTVYQGGIQGWLSTFV